MVRRQAASFFTPPFFNAILFALIATLVGSNAFAQSSIHFNQLGFLPHGSKVVVVPNVQAGAFYLVAQDNNHEMLRGPLSQPQAWDVAGDKVKIADFTAFNKPGTYRLRIQGLPDSKPFTIKEGAYDEAIRTVARSLYMHRAGAPLAERYAGQYARGSLYSDLLVSIHPSSASNVYPANTYSSFPKGWFNGSDYGKYVIANTFTLAALLNAYLDFPSFAKTLSFNIPKTQNNTPDLILEALWSVEWLLSMQDADGGVYHGVSSLGGPNSSQTQTRALMPKSTAATLHYAAVMALVSRVAESEPSLKSMQKKAQSAAIAAWKWALKNPKTLYVQPSQFGAQAYAEANEDLKDEWLWAATELWVLTGAKEYFKKIKLPEQLRPAVWNNMEQWALYSLAQYSKTPIKIQQAITQSLNAQAHASAQLLWKSGYLVPMEATDFTHNSNGIALARAVTLLKTHAVTPNKDYEPTARALVDYLFGRNPLGVSYVSGLGRSAASNIPHPLSQADNTKAVMPGLVVSGPDAGAAENCGYSSKLAAKAYIDSTCTKTNSVSIDRQALLLYVLMGLREAHL